MDFHFGNLVLGSAVNHGVEIGEAFYVASQIKDGDAASWHKAWYGLAQRAEARGERSLAAGHVVSARGPIASRCLCVPHFPYSHDAGQSGNAQKGA